MRVTSKLASLAVVLTSAALALSCTAAGSAGASTAATGSAGAGAAAAVGAARPAWQVMYRLPGTDITAVSASGPDSAWAAGNFWDAKGCSRGRLLHWDGSRWRLVSYPDQRVHLISAVYALTASDAWFAVYGTGNGELLHWSQGRWSTMSLPVDSQSIYVVSDRDIWAAGGTLPHCYDGPADTRGCTVTSHWNGSSWTSYPLRAFQGVSFAGQLWLGRLGGRRQLHARHPRHSVVRAVRLPLDRVGLESNRADTAPKLLVAVDRRVLAPRRLRGGVNQGAPERLRHALERQPVDALLPDGLGRPVPLGHLGLSPRPLVQRPASHARVCLGALDGWPGRDNAGLSACQDRMEH